MRALLGRSSDIERIYMRENEQYATDLRQKTMPRPHLVFDSMDVVEVAALCD